MGFLVAGVGGFSSGILLRSVWEFGWEPIVFVGVLALMCGVAWFLVPRRAYTLGAVFCLFVVLGMLRAGNDTPLPSVFAQDLKHRVSYEGIVVADPDLRDASQRVEVRVKSGEVATTMLVVASRSPSVGVGDRVYVAGTLTLPEPFADDNGRIFRYDKYLERDGVRFILNFAFLRVVTPAPWYSISAALARVKHLFLDGLATTLPEPASSLAGGVVIGGKTGLGSDLQNAFVRSGLVQIIVLSGYNVMIVAEWIMAILAFTRLSRRWGAFAGATAVLIFVGIAGLSATALRAALMAMIALYAHATGRTYAASRALLVAVFLMLLYNPLYLAFDPGFGLSVVATAGLIWLVPIIEIRLGFIKNAFFKNAASTTLAAQIAVLPLLLYDTGNLSLVSLPANILAMPIVPLSMGFSALAGLAGILFSPLAPLLGIMSALPAYLTNTYLIWLARESAALPFAAFTLPPFPSWLVLLAYAALIAIASSKRFSATSQLRLAKNASISARSLLFMLGALAALTFFIYRPLFSASIISVSVLEAGKGHAVLIRSPKGDLTLVDTGSDASILRALGETLAPWQRSLDTLILTSDKNAEKGGLSYVINRYHIKKVMSVGGQTIPYGISLPLGDATLTAVAPAVFSLSYGSSSMKISSTSLARTFLSDGNEFR